MLPEKLVPVAMLVFNSEAQADFFHQNRIQKASELCNEKPELDCACHQMLETNERSFHDTS